MEIWATEDRLRAMGPELERRGNSDRQAQLAALRVVLGWPHKPVCLKEFDDVPDQTSKGLAIDSEKSDVCSLTARAHLEVGGQEELK